MFQLDETTIEPVAFHAQFYALQSRAFALKTKTDKGISIFVFNALPLQNIFEVITNLI